MTISNLLKIGLRLLGLYICMLGSLAVPDAFLTMAVASNIDGLSAWEVIIISLLTPVIALIFGLTLLVFSRGLYADDVRLNMISFEEHVFPGAIQLIGIFIVYGAVEQLVMDVVRPSSAYSGWLLYTGFIAASGILLFVGIFLIVFAKSFSQWLRNLRNDGENVRNT